MYARMAFELINADLSFFFTCSSTKGSNCPERRHNLSFFFLDFPGTNPVSVNEAQTVHSSKLNYMELSQAIHPIVGTPFLQLHPCLSQELLRGMPNR